MRRRHRPVSSPASRDVQVVMKALLASALAAVAVAVGPLARADTEDDNLRSAACAGFSDGTITNRYQLVEIIYEQLINDGYGPDHGRADRIAAVACAQCPNTPCH